MNGRAVVLSVGPARSPWPREVARWSTAGLIGIAHHPCLSIDEVSDRLADDTQIDVVMIDGSLWPNARGLVAQATELGVAVVVVTDDPRDWTDADVKAVVEPPSEPETLRRLLDQIRPQERRSRPAATPVTPTGRFVAVTGHGGSGRSTVAQGLATRWTAEHDVLLADCSLHADQHVIHDLTDAGPGLVDLVAASGRSTLDCPAIRSTAAPTSAGYHLLPGVRRHRDWTALPSASVAAAVDDLTRAFAVVVADLDDELEGRTETGSFDLEERNGLTRAAVASATAVIVVGRADLLGLHRLTTQLEAVLAFGVAADRVHPVVNQCRGGRARRLAFRRDTQTLLGPLGLPNPLCCLPHLRDLESRRRDGRATPMRLQSMLAPLDRSLEGAERGPITAEPETVGVDR